MAPSPKFQTNRRLSVENQSGPASAAAYQARRSPENRRTVSSGQTVNTTTAAACA